MGAVVISVDAELGWGFHDRATPPIHRIDAGRDGWARLLALFDEYEVPATWAIVGHLFLDDCDGTHREHPTPPGWFARERGEWRARREWRFAGDLVGDILDARADHDLGCHTFSHTIFTDPRITEDVVRAELAAAASAARPYGVEFRSFVFPRNAVAYRDVLAEFGFTSYRGHVPRSPGGSVQSVRKITDTIRPGRIPLVRPHVDEHGLVNVPASLFLFGFERTPRTVVETLWIDPIVRQAKHGVDRAALEDGVFHMWLHPNNLTDERDARRIRAILEHLDRRREESSLTVETMDDIARDVLRDGPRDESRTPSTRAG